MSFGARLPSGYIKRCNRKSLQIGVSIGKAPVHSVFSIAMFDYRRACLLSNVNDPPVAMEHHQCSNLQIHLQMSHKKKPSRLQNLERKIGILHRHVALKWDCRLRSLQEAESSDGTISSFLRDNHVSHNVSILYAHA